MYSTREISRNQLNHFRNYLSLTSLKKIIWVFLPQGIDFQMSQDDEHLTHTHTQKTDFLLTFNKPLLMFSFPFHGHYTCLLPRPFSNVSRWWTYKKQTVTFACVMLSFPFHGRPLHLLFYQTFFWPCPLHNRSSKHLFQSNIFDLSLSFLLFSNSIKMKILQAHKSTPFKATPLRYVIQNLAPFILSFPTSADDE